MKGGRGAGEDTAGRADTPLTERELDDELRQAVASAGTLRRWFYLVVLLVALAGQVSGAMEKLGLPLLVALGAALPLELGAVVVLHNADVRRRLGERATVWRLLSAGISLGSVTWAVVSHADPLVGGFCAGFSLLGYLVYLLDSEAVRRDRLRAKGQLPPTTPAYELIGHWLRHPWLTRRARALAKQEPGLGLYGSVDAAREQIRRERREAAIAKVLHRKIKATVDRTTADIAVAVYDLNQIAARLADGADYDGLTALIAADLTPARIATAAQPATREAVAEPTQDSAAATHRGPAEPTHATRVEPTQDARESTQGRPAESAHTGAAEPGRVEPGRVESARAATRIPPLRPARPPRVAAAHSRAPRLTVALPTDGPEQNARLAAAYADLAELLGREPSGAELGDKAGVSKATANRWKANRPTAVTR